MKKQLMTAAAAAVLVLAAGTAAIAEEAPFSQVVVFGDSLSDAGNFSLGVGLGQQLSFTTNPGDVAAQYVADHYDLDLSASLAGGTNYAFGGAGVLNNNPGTPGAFPTLTGQVTSYIGAHGALDSDALFIFWGGANDIFYHATLTALGLQTPQASVVAMGSTGTAAGALINNLQTAGAGLVVVLNLPNTGITPAARAQDQLTPGFGGLLTAMAQQYNSALDAAMFRREGVMPVNVYAFFNEVVASPGTYGFTNITGVACLTPSSLVCSPATLVDPNAPNTYLFADGVHPTTAAHRAVADLIVSELAAPRQMSLLPESAVALGANTSLTIDHEMAGRLGSEQTGVHVFATGGYLNGETNGQLIDVPATDGEGFMVTGGFSFPVGQRTIAGLAGTVGRNTLTWAGDHGEFETTMAGVTVFAQHGDGDGLYVNGQGRLMAFGYDVERTFRLGVATRSELSSPTAWGAAARIGAGYWFGLGGARTGPFASAEYQQVKLDGFREESNDSTAMTFGDQTRESLVGEIGWAVKGEMASGGAAWRPFASIAYAYDANAERSEVTAGLVTLNGTFTLAGYKPEQTWISAGAGLAVDFGPGWGGHLAYAGRFGEDDRNGHSVMVGLNAHF